MTNNFSKKICAIVALILAFSSNNLAFAQDVKTRIKLEEKVNTQDSSQTQKVGDNLKVDTANKNEDPDLRLSIDELKKKYPIDWLERKYGDRNSNFCQESFGPDDVTLNWPCGTACKSYPEIKNCPQNCYGQGSPKNLVCNFLQDDHKPKFKLFSIAEYKSAFLYYNDTTIDRSEIDKRAFEIVVVAIVYFIQNRAEDLSPKENSLKNFLWSRILINKLQNPAECKFLQNKIRISYSLDPQNLCQNQSIQ